jgi:hypothetical protein
MPLDRADASGGRTRANAADQSHEDGFSYSMPIFCLPNHTLLPLLFNNFAFHFLAPKRREFLPAPLVWVASLPSVARP